LPRKNWKDPIHFGVNLKVLKEDDTYCLVFSPTQKGLLDALLEEKRVKILFQGKKAVNKVQGHGTLPRNTLVIFELK